MFVNFVIGEIEGSLTRTWIGVESGKEIVRNGEGGAEVVEFADFCFCPFPLVVPIFEQFQKVGNGVVYSKEKDDVLGWVPWVPTLGRCQFRWFRDPGRHSFYLCCYKS